MKYRLGDSLNETKKAVTFTVFAGMLWGSSFPMIKIGLKFVDAYMFAFLRFFLASALMFMLLLFTKKLTLKFSKRKVLFLGILNGFSYLLQYVGMTSTAASKSSLLVNLTAVWVTVLSLFILKEKFGNKKLFGIIFGIVGVFLVTTNLNFFELTQGTLIGDILVLSSGISWSFFIIYNKKFIADAENTFQLMSWVLFVTVLPLVPFVPFSSNLSLNLPIEAWAAIGYTALFCWIVPYYLWLKGLKYISSAASTVVLLIEIVVAVVISNFALGEGFTLTSSAGALLILLAVLLVSLE
jgi:drug/metabolite transporter (DMT)-like permease